ATRRHETGEVAKPLFYRGRPAWIAIYTRPFTDADEVVSLVRNRLLEASGAALLVALVSGFFVARALTRRVKRLEAAARDLAALEAGSVEVECEEVDLGELAVGVTNEFRPALVQHQTHLDLRLPDEQVEAICDRERVVQIMRILLDNALRHTPEGTDVTVS